MDVFEAAGDCGCVESGLVGRERLYVSEISEEFSSIDEFKDKIEILRILGETFESHNEGVVDLRMNKVFIIDMIYLLGFHYFMFV